MNVATASAKTILLVEDDADTREAIARVLEVDGYSVVEARDGEEAWSMISKRGVPGLILLDMMMPNMNGQQFLSVRERDARLDDVPVIVMTASGATPAGVTIVRKPFMIRSLLSLVARTFGRGVHRRN